MPRRAELIDKLFANMNATKRILICHLRAESSEDRLPPSQGELLIIAQQYSPLTLKQLAERMLLTPGAVSQLVEGLERANLVKREPSLQDRRVVNVLLTPEGERRLAKMKQKHAEIFKQMANALSDEELEAMVNIQNKMIAHLQITYNNTIPEENRPNGSKSTK